MKLAILTIVLDGMPWIEKHLPIFRTLSCDWEWWIMHGAANNGGSTAWCSTQKPRLSRDGTTEYLHSISGEARVFVCEKRGWKSKDEMVNNALAQIEYPCVLLEVDSDEFWKPHQIEAIVKAFHDRPDLSSIMFDCRYFVGEHLVTQGTDCFGSHSYEWLRAWRYTPGRRFVSHEPPRLEGDDPNRRMSKEESRRLGLVFDHLSYVTEEQVEYKSQFYGYGSSLVESWRKLQTHNKFPVELNRFFSFLPPNEKAQVMKI